MGYIGGFDQNIIRGVQLLPAGLRPIMLLITTIGSPVSAVIILMIVIARAYMRKAKRLACIAAALVLAMPLASLFKELTKRIRPDTPYVKSMLIKTYSFPSGHAYASFLVFGLLAYLAWRYRAPATKWSLTAAAVIMIGLVGVSRIYLGAHFPSDVIGGWILGGIVLALVLKFGRARD